MTTKQKTPYQKIPGKAGLLYLPGIINAICTRINRSMTPVEYWPESISDSIDLEDFTYAAIEEQAKNFTLALSTDELSKFLDAFVRRDDNLEQIVEEYKGKGCDIEMLYVFLEATVLCYKGKFY